MAFSLPERLIILDTEFTAWEGSNARSWSGSGEYREIIQIGAIKVDTATLSETDSFMALVKPVKNPQLSDYIQNLTHITQAAVDEHGLAYADALETFQKWVGEFPLYCFGRDGEIMAENAALLDIDFPFTPEQFTDVRPIFRAHGYAAVQSGRMLEEFGLPVLPGEHDAVNDVRSILAALRELCRLVNISTGPVDAK